MPTVEYGLGYLSEVRSQKFKDLVLINDLQNETEYPEDISVIKTYLSEERETETGQKAIYAARSWM
jgi:hypothetical protein